MFRTANVVWAISGALAAVAAIALAPVRGVSLAGAAAAGGALSYQLLLRALVVALLARMRSLPIVLVAGIGVGIVEVILQQNVDPSDLGVTELWLFLATLVIVLVFSRVVARDRRRRVEGEPRRYRVRAVDAGGPWWSRHLGRIGIVALFGVLVLIPVFFSRASESFLWTRVLIFAIAGCSLTILTGWAGQVSLGQFGFAAVGGLVTVKLVGDDGILGLHHLPWGVAVVIGVLVGAAVAVLIGLPALRIPGLYLAVTTLAFAVFVSVWLVAQGTFLDASGLLPTLAKPDAGIVDFASRRSYYYLCLAFLLACVALVAQLRRTGVGRSVIAVRDNPASAAGMTISTVRTKLLAFAVSGGMAALAGCLLVTLLPEQHAGGDVRARGVGEGRRHRGDRRAGRVRRSGARRAVGGGAARDLARRADRALPRVGHRHPRDPALRPRRLRRHPPHHRDLAPRPPRLLASRLRQHPRIPRSRDATSVGEGAIAVPEGDWLVATGMTVRFGGRVAVDHVDVRVGAAGARRPHRHQRRGQEHAHERDRRLRARRRGTSRCWDTT